MDDPDRPAWAGPSDDEGLLALRSAGDPDPGAPGGSMAATPDQRGAIPPAPVTGEQDWPVRFGPYRVTALLGRGGMGLVYAAEQTEPIRRRVAVKVIRTGAPEHVAARFAAEREALARMEHPNIARVLDAGISDRGIPWVAMERVDGQPIGRWCDERRLAVRQRVALVIAVCHAVQHAHQKGIVHRDLKPSNILVEDHPGGPVPKVIDFGVAKAVGDAHLSGDSLATQTGMIVGTPAYMSPEQADGVIDGDGVDVDTRSDVYALGVVLYELLTGALPLDPAGTSLTAFVSRLVSRLYEVPPPSARVLAVSARETGDGERRARAAARGTEPAALARELRGDLDAIALKALAPERERRYATARDLAADLERFLAFEPIAARPPGTLYRLGRLAWRRPAAFTLAASALVSLVALTAVSTVQARRVARARAVAEQRRGQAEELIRFMVGDLSAKLQPIGKLDIMDAVGTRALAYFAAVPGAELTDDELLHRSEALGQLGQVRLAQGDGDRALAAFRESLAQARDLAARDSAPPERLVQLGAAHFWVGSIHYERRALDSALAHFRPYLALSERLVARDPANAAWQAELGYAWSNLGSVREAQGDLAGALDAFRFSLRVKTRLVALDTSDMQRRLDLGNAHNTVGVIHEKRGPLDSALAHFRADLAIKRALVAREPANAPWRDALSSARVFAAALDHNRGDARAAAAGLDTACADIGALAASDPANVEWARTVVTCRTRLARVRLALGAPGAALAELRRVHGTARALAARAPGEAPTRVALAAVEREFAEIHRALGAPAEARAASARSSAALATIDASAARHGDVVLARARARLLDAELDPARRTAALTEALQALGPAPREEPLVATALRARALRALGRGAEAAPLVARLRAAGFRGPDAPL